MEGEGRWASGAGAAAAPADALPRSALQGRCTAACRRRRRGSCASRYRRPPEGPRRGRTAGGGGRGGVSAGRREERGPPPRRSRPFPRSASGGFGRSERNAKRVLPSPAVRRAQAVARPGLQRVNAFQELIGRPAGGSVDLIEPLVSSKFVI